MIFSGHKILRNHGCVIFNQIYIFSFLLYMIFYTQFSLFYRASMDSSFLPCTKTEGVTLLK